jgi:hypothetical protein
LDRSKEEAFIEGLDTAGKVMLIHRLGERRYIHFRTMDAELNYWQFRPVREEQVIKELDGKSKFYSEHRK